MYTAGILGIWLATFEYLKLLLYLHVTATPVMSEQIAVWSDRVQAAVTGYFHH